MGRNIYKRENKVVKYTFIVIRNICLAFLIALVAAFALGYKFLNILTGSMTPTMPVNTVVIIKQIDMQDVEVGDVVTFKVGDSNVTHRVVEKDDSGRNIVLKTQGDAAENQGSRETVTKENYVGTVIYYVKDLGVLLELIKENIIIIVVCIVLALFIVTYS